MKTVLHVGCGPLPSRLHPSFAPGQWRELRLDLDPKVAPDFVASITDMAPVPGAAVDAVYSSHNLEHLYPHEVPLALAECVRVLRPDGYLLITLPDLQAVARLVAEDKLEDAAYVSQAGPIAPLDILYGHRPSLAAGNLYMAHRTGFTARTLARALVEAGFAGVEARRDEAALALWAQAYMPAHPAIARLRQRQAAAEPALQAP